MKPNNEFLRSLNITRPIILLDPKKVKRNIERMTHKARSAGVTFRPHFKTHQSAEVGTWFRERGTDAITVSSLSMAKYFAEHGWEDITVAFPVNKREIDLINSLAQTVQLNLMVDHSDVVLFLEASLEHPTNVLIEIDTGYGRTGVLWEDAEYVLDVARTIHSCAKLDFLGLLTHAGQSYDATTEEQIRIVHEETVSRLTHLKDVLLREGLPQCLLSIGDTPTCSVVDDFGGIDEIRPGAFVFYDFRLHQIGACTADEIAIAVACPVVGTYPRRQEIVIYGGAVHFSKDYILNECGEKAFGYMTSVENNQWGAVVKKAYITSLTQEHGEVKVTGDLFDTINVGDVLLFLPIHACLTGNLHRQYVTTEGETLSRFNSTFY